MSEREAPPPETVELALTWGPVIRGVRWGSGPSRIIFLHEPGTDLDAWGTLPRDLATALSLVALVYDLPGHGLSDDPWEPARLAEIVNELCAPTPESPKPILVAAGATAIAALTFPAVSSLAGLVGLSPSSIAAPPPRSPDVPKHLFAGAQAGDDLAAARLLAAKVGGWAVVTSVPTAARGTGLLHSPWGHRFAEAAAAFIRDCLRQAVPTSRLPLPRTGEPGTREVGGGEGFPPG